MSPGLRAEWVKLRTVASTGWLLLGIVMVTVAASAAADAAGLCTSSAGCQPDVTRLTLTGTGVGQALAAILGTLAVTGEYGTGMIRTTLAAVPRRTAMLTAKAAVTGGLTLAAGAVAVLGSVLAGELILPGHGLTLPAGPMARAATGTVLGLLYLFPDPRPGDLQPGLAPAPAAARADDRRAGDPGQHQPERPAHRAVGGSGRARRLGRRRAAGRRPAAPPP